MSRNHQRLSITMSGLLILGFAVAASAQGTAQINQRDYYYNGINKTPWYSDPALRRHLQLNDEQFNRLNQNYARAWDRYDQGVEGLTEVAEAERQQRLQELSGDFHKDFGQSSEEVFTDPAARARYNQLHLQYRGYGAFNDPNVRVQLNLTPAQIARFNNYDRDWNRDMRTWQRDYATNSDVILKRYNDSRSEYNERLKSDLTPRQLRAFSDLAGEPYNFSPEVYFQNAPSTSPVVRPTLK